LQEPRQRVHGQHVIMRRRSGQGACRGEGRSAGVR
jgi:hypothetical protein